MTRTVIRLVIRGLKDMGLNPWALMLTLAAVSLVAFLAGLFLMALVSINHHLGTVRGETAFQVYWRPGTEAALVSEQWETIMHVPGFSRIKTFTPNEALRELGTRIGRSPSGSNSLTRTFPALAEKAPLPATALVTFLPEEQDYDRWLTEVTAYLKGLPAVERVAATPLRDELGHAWRKISHFIMWPSIGFLCLVLALVVGNTIRLSLVARAQEIEILKLVGAFTWYIRLPLVVSGAAQGFLGGCFALTILNFVHSHIKGVLNFPPLMVEIQFLPLSLCILLLVVPTLMGILGSWTAVKD